jgi:hypothetical protein
VNLAFEGVVSGNDTVQAMNVVVPSGESWRLAILTLKQVPVQVGPIPNAITARLSIQTGVEERQVYMFSGDQTFIRENLASVLESGESLKMTVTSRLTDSDVNFEGYISLERRSITPEGAMRVLVINQPEHYLHFQGVPASVWTINHNLGFYPGGVSVVDSGGGIQVGQVHYVDVNTLTVSFFVGGHPVAFSGAAFLS